jgi:hypothetical protein
MHIEGMNKTMKSGILVFFALIVCATTLIRVEPFDGTAFEHEKIQSYGKIWLYAEDSLVKDGRKLIETPYDWLVIITGMKNILPIIFGALSAVMLYFLLLKLGIKERTSFFSSLLMILSPLFIFIFSLNNYYSMIIFLNIAGLLCRNKKYLSAFCYCLLAFFGAANFMLSIAALLIVNRYNKTIGLKKIIPALLVFTAHTIWMYLQNAVFYPEIAYNEPGIISGIGALNGVSAFFAILVVTGIIQHWKENKQTIFMSLVLAACAVFYSSALNFALPVLSVLAGTGFSALLDQKWSAPYLKKMTLFIFILGILFSLISYNTAILKEQPTEEMIKGYEFMNGLPKGVILTHASRGALAGTLSRMPSLLDENPYGIKNYEEKKSDSEKIFHTYELKNAAALLRKNEVKYIAIDSEMKTGLVWEKENQELLYLLGAKEYFKKIYSNSQIEIWLFDSAVNET